MGESHNSDLRVSSNLKTIIALSIVAFISFILFRFFGPDIKSLATKSYFLGIAFVSGFLGCLSGYLTNYLFGFGYDESGKRIYWLTSLSVFIISFSFLFLSFWTKETEKKFLASIQDFREINRSEFCPDEDKSKKISPIVLKQCAYIKSLKESGQKIKGSLCDNLDKLEEEKKECDLRKRGEPWLHYRWRRLVTDSKKVKNDISNFSFSDWKNETGKKFDKLGLRAEIQSIPFESPGKHSFHHLWINLVDQDEESPSYKNINEAVDTLLFSTEHAVPAINPNVFKLHFDAAKGFCSKLVDDTAAMLSGEELSEQYNVLFNNCTVKNEYADHLKDLLSDKKLSDEEKEIELAKIEKVDCGVPKLKRSITLACIEIDPGLEKAEFKEKTRKSKNKFGSFEIHVKGLFLPEMQRQLDFTKAESGPFLLSLAKLITPEFQYTGFRKTIELGALLDKEQVLMQMQQNGLKLTNLYLLEVADPFKEGSLVFEDPSFKEVYPYNESLEQFLKIYRSNFKILRGSL